MYISTFSLGTCHLFLQNTPQIAVTYIDSLSAKFSNLSTAEPTNVICNSFHEKLLVGNPNLVQFKPDPTGARIRGLCTEPRARRMRSVISEAIAETTLGEFYCGSEPTTTRVK